MALKKGWLAEGIGNIIAAGVSKTGESVANAAGIDLKALVPPETDLTTPLDEAVTATLSTIGGIIGSPLGLLPAMMLLYHSGRGQQHIQAANKAFLPARLPPEQFARLYFRGIITGKNYDLWLNDLKEQGWNPTRVQALTEAYRPLMSLAEIREAFLRGRYGEGEKGRNKAIKKIRELGFSGDNASDLIELFYVLPPAQDVIRWAAREVFEPELRKRYRLDEDLPPDFLNWAAKVGITGEVARNYWAAHWELPSLLMVTDMWHRGIIEDSDMDSFFIQLDMNPYWREKIKEASYEIPTRVDIRRMYKIGVINEQDVYDLYRARHYSDLNAKRMVEFTMRYYPQEEMTDDNEVRELTKAEILRLYRERVIPRDGAVAGLTELAYVPGVADALVTIEDVRLASEYKKERLKYIYAAYKAGNMSDTELTDALGKLNISGDEMEYHQNKLFQEEVEKVAIPSLGDVKRWLKRGIIPEAIFRGKLTDRGYIREDIERYIEEVNKTPAGDIQNE